MANSRTLRRHPVRLLALATILFVLPSGARAESALSCERVPQLLGAFFQKHISYGYLNQELRQRAVESYLKRLDPSKTLLLESEAIELQAQLMGVFHDVYSGDCSQLEKLQTDVLSRYATMEEFVRAYVSRDDYEVDPAVMLVIDPDKRGYSTTPEAREELYRKFVHFQMSNYLTTDMPMAEAKKKLIHRYELMTKRAGELEQEDVYAAFLDAFASSMDPHSHYLSADVLEDFQIDMRLSLDGIGVALSSRDGYSIVEKIIPGGATAKLGVLIPKDRVIGVAQEGEDFVDVVDMDLRDVVRLIRGERGTKVHLRVLRQLENAETLTVTIVRDKINLEERSAKLRFETVQRGDKKLKLAVIDLPSFYGDRNPAKRQSSRDLRNLLAEVREAKADGLLLDLSRNGGGLLETAVEITGFFIEEGGVVAVKGTDSGVQVLRDTDDSILYDGPMVILTSRVSASASEIVAGAMKDYRRAIVVGDDHTFGKGTVQSMVPLPPGLGALKVTTALFFRPGGDSTQHSGVASDIIVPSLSSTADFGEAFQPYSLPSQKIDPFVEAQDEGDDEESSDWTAVTDTRVAELARRSAERVGKSDEFTELQEKIAEAEKRDGVIHLAEILEEKERADGENGDAAGSTVGGEGDADPASPIAAGDASVAPPETEVAEEPDEPSLQQREALGILADWISLSQSGGQS